ncbi:MAG: hypothetical protein U0031_07065 [Thermomicrobiales bacterium]
MNSNGLIATGYLVACLLITPLIVSAQQSTAVERLPQAGDLPAGWVVSSAEQTAPSDVTAINDLAEAVYLGPNGSRAWVLLAQVNAGPAAARTSWELMGNSFDNLRGTFDADYNSERELREMPMPKVAGCADMRRMRGTDNVIDSIDVGVSLCAADPDSLILAYVSGAFGDLSGPRASDALIGLVLSDAPGATPEAG